MLCPPVLQARHALTRTIEGRLTIKGRTAVEQARQYPQSMPALRDSWRNRGRLIRRRFDPRLGDAATALPSDYPQAHQDDRMSGA